MAEHETGYDGREDVTEILLAWSRGERAAVERLMPLVYRELHALASSYMRRENSGHTLQATALVHEAYLRLIDQERVEWRNRAHFFAVAAHMMRRILVDHARRRRAARRGGGQPTVTLTEVAGDLMVTSATDILAVDQALTALAAIDGDKCRLVELRYFAGLSNAEIAEVMGVSTATLARQWRIARAWLYRHLHQEVVDVG